MSGAEDGGDALVRSETENGNGDRSGDGDRETGGEDDAMVCDGPVFDRLMWNLLAPCQRGAEGREEEDGGEKVLERRGETGSADEDKDEDEEEEEHSVPLGSALKGLGGAGFGTTRTETETETDVDADAVADAEADPNLEKDLVEKYEALDLREGRGEVGGRGAEGRDVDEGRRGQEGE
ncbi:hypothetical protein Tdes44962_MAKER07405 [Teratosphaeria destructans]|uniref:Uncharacterized protein n=1 Tax=Teratosphaeria destructans TaxID=418781 RepID=A0A9W7W6A1_9PEZI|nr:hypothetical protein Tdes44962_MAKER07405 [Teratosphaeria destructans]